MHLSTRVTLNGDEPRGESLATWSLFEFVVTVTVMKSDKLLKSILRTKFNGPCLRFGHHSLVPYGVIHHGRKEPRERMRMSSLMFGRGFEGKTPHITKTKISLKAFRAIESAKEPKVSHRFGSA